MAFEAVMANSSGPLPPYALAYSAQSLSFGYPDGTTVVDLVPDHIKHLIHPHWSNYPPVNPMWHYVLAVIYIFLALLSFFGNGMVLYLFLKTKSLRTPANYLVFNLSFSDFFMMVTQYPWYIWNCFNGGVWMFGVFSCEIYAATGAVTGLCSLWTLAFISFDRYNVIVKGMNAKPLTTGKAMMMILFCWTYAIGWSLPPFFGWGRYIPEGILDACSFDYLTRDWEIRSHSLCLFIFDFCVPFSIILFCYIFIVNAIFQHEKSMREQAKKMNVSNLRSNADANAQSAEVRIAKVAVTTVALWLMCWVPYASVVVTGIFFDQTKLTPIVSMLPSLLCKTASCYNPVVYAINHPKFRLALQKEVPGFCIHEEDPKTDDSKSTETTNKESA